MKVCLCKYLLKESLCLLKESLCQCKYLLKVFVESVSASIC